MRNETSDVHGNFVKGNICCDIDLCLKVLYQWDNKINIPKDDRACFVAFSVKARIIFSRYPTNLAISAMQPARWV